MSRKLLAILVLVPALILLALASMGEGISAIFGTGDVRGSTSEARPLLGDDASDTSTTAAPDSQDNLRSEPKSSSTQPRVVAEAPSKHNAQTNPTSSPVNDGDTSNQSSVPTAAGSSAGPSDEEGKRPPLLLTGTGVEADASEDTSRSLSSTDWSETRFTRRFLNRGEQPPPSVMTEVTGKILGLPELRGLANAALLLHSFFPEVNAYGSPVTPVMTETTTNASGDFTATVPLPKVLPKGHPGLTVSVFRLNMVKSGKPELILAPVTVEGLIPGKRATIGVFRAPTDLTYVEVTCDWTSESTLHSVGVINPSLVTVDLANALQPLRVPVSRSSESGVQLLTHLARHSDGYRPLALLKGDALVASDYGTNQRPGNMDAYNALLTEHPDLSTDRLMLTAHFELKPNSGTTLRGQVIDANGYGLANAVVTFRAGLNEYSRVSDGSGGFVFDSAPNDVTEISASHKDWGRIYMDLSSQANLSALVLTLTDQLPRWQFDLRDDTNGQTIALASFAFRHKLWNAGNEAVWVDASTELPGDFGRFHFKWDNPVKDLVIQAVGYAPHTVKLPTNPDEAREIRLQPTISLEIEPNAFTPETRTDRNAWNSIEGTTDVFAYSMRIPAEYDFDVRPEGELTKDFKPRKFDLLLGTRNQGIVDNNYQFVIDVYIDGTKKGRLHIKANTETEFTDTLNLGELSGAHRLRLVWMNDRWIPDQLDANIRLCTIRIYESGS